MQARKEQENKQEGRKDEVVEKGDETITRIKERESDKERGKRCQHTIHFRAARTKRGKRKEGSQDW